jgi:flagellar basal-body rod protein FlgF
MLYGLYLSATGVMTNSYRQDVIANNLANSETVGFKKDLAMFRQRPTAAEEMPGKTGWSNPLFEGIGGGTYAEPTVVDTSEGGLEHTGNKLDAAIQGTGFFTVDDHGTTKLTRNGQFMIDSNGMLVTTNGKQNVLDSQGNPIKLDSRLEGQTNIAQDGTISQGNAIAGKLGVVDVPDPAKLTNEGGTLFSYPTPGDFTPATTSVVHGETVENANVDSATELTALMDTQRQLEANANMIHYQDSTLDKLINTVGKIS